MAEKLLNEGLGEDVSLYSGKLAFIPYIRNLSYAKQNSAYLGVLAGTGAIGEYRYLRLDPFYFVSLDSGVWPIRINSKRYHYANNILEFVIPWAIIGTPDDIVRRIMMMNLEEQFDLLSDFIRKIKTPYSSFLENVLENSESQLF